MDYRILGPLEVYDGGRRLEPGQGKQRALLVLLLLHANEVVSADRLIEELWGDDQPANAPKSLQVHVSRLRRALQALDRGTAQPLLTRGGGYLLRVGPGELDTDRCRELVERGRSELAAGDPEAAAVTLRDALAVYRGPPLADVVYDSFAQEAIRRLEELRLAALVERIDADLALGRHERVIGELQALAEQHPLQERLRAQLMLALYRCGRQAEGLQAYQDARRTLASELGLEPGRPLRELEQAILRQDASLDPPPTRSPRKAAVGWALGAGRRRVVLGLTVAAAVAAAAALVLRTSSHPVGVAPNSVAVVDPRTNHLVGDIRVGNAPAVIASGAGAIWVLNGDDSTISRIDPKLLAVTRTFSPGGEPTSLAVGAGSVWVENSGATVTRIEAESNLVAAVVHLPRLTPLHRSNTCSGSIAVGRGAVWVSDPGEQAIWQIDPRRDRVVATIATPTGIDKGGTIIYAATAVWDAFVGGDVLRIDPSTNAVSASVPLPSGLGGIAAGAGSVWVAGENDLWQIDPQLGNVGVAVTIGSGPSEGSSWVASGYGSLSVASASGVLSRIDPTAAEVMKTIDLGRPLRGIATGGGDVWISAG